MKYTIEFPLDKNIDKIAETLQKVKDSVFVINHSVSLSQMVVKIKVDCDEQDMVMICLKLGAKAVKKS